MTLNDIDKEWAQFMSAPSNKYGENDANYDDDDDHDHDDACDSD
jgi:hypothetical protein